MDFTEKMNSTNDIFSMTLDEYIATKKENFAVEAGAFRSKPLNTFCAQNDSNESNFKAERRSFNKEEVDEEKEEDMSDLESHTDNAIPQSNDIDILGESGSETINMEINYSDDNCENVNKQAAANEPVLQKFVFDSRERITNSGSRNKDDGNVVGQIYSAFESNCLVQQQKQKSVSTTDTNFHIRRYFYRKHGNRSVIDGPYGRNSSGNSYSPNSNANRFKSYAGNNNGSNNKITSNCNNRRPTQQFIESGRNVNNRQIRNVSDSTNGFTITLDCKTNVTGTLPQPVQDIAKGTAEAPKDIDKILGVTLITPALTSKFSELTQVGQQQTTTHKSKYDMKIQKEIHELQGKPLIYECATGKVVSPDGAGIENCYMKPHATGITLNCRFRCAN